MRQWVIGVIALLFVTTAFAGPRQVPRGVPIQLRLQPGLQAAIQFPEPLLKNFAMIWPDLYTVDAYGSYLMITLKDPAYVGRFFAIGQSGFAYQVEFRDGTPADAQVQVIDKPGTQPTAQAQPFTPLSLLRVLRRAVESHGPLTVPGSTVAEVPLPATGDSRVNLGTIQAVYVGPLIGLVLPLTNTTQDVLTLNLELGKPLSSPEPHTVPLTTWDFPPGYLVRAIAAVPERLDPASQARLYVVLEGRPR
jgi:hypothetical protein